MSSNRWLGVRLLEVASFYLVFALLLGLWMSIRKDFARQAAGEARGRALGRRPGPLRGRARRVNLQASMSSRPRTSRAEAPDGVVHRIRTEREDLELMAREVREGLARPLPELPCKFFYDERGSELFEEITRLPEYYQTRTETAVLEEHAAALVETVSPRELVELGSGAGRKIRLFLDAMRARASLESVVLLEIAEAYLRESVERLQADYPEGRVRGLVGDFVFDMAALGPGGDRLLLFLAGTIGNLHPDDLPGFFRGAAAVLEPGDGFVVGVDLVKDPSRLHAAYNDAAGVTAEFNLNILRVLNERLEADFDVDAFEHRAFYDPERQWIEMRLRARRPTQARVAGASVVLRAGAEIRTELSCKYTRASLEARLEGSGLVVEQWLTDRDCLFASALLRRQ
jgi:L-histidine N-alpha-methyltransferase